MQSEERQSLIAEEERVRGAVRGLPDSIVAQEAAERAQVLEAYYQEHIVPHVPVCLAAERSRRWAAMSPAERRDRLEGCLLKAAEQGDLGKVVRLVERGVSVHTKTPVRAITPLFIASNIGCADIVRLLLKHGADPNCVEREEGMTPIYVASKEGHTEVVYELLCVGADPRVVSRSGFCPLHPAVGNGHVEVVELLCRCRPPLFDMRDDNSATPLHHAAYRNDGHIVDLLCQAGASLDVKDKDGDTPLDIANMLERTDAMRVLLAHRNERLRQQADRAGDDAVRCPICQEDDGELIAAHVGGEDHRFHRDCWQSWQASRVADELPVICPVCRVSVV